MALNTFVAGDTTAIRALVEGLGTVTTGVEETATGWHRTRSESESGWEGEAAEAYRDKAARSGTDADDLETTFRDASRALTAVADDLDTVKARMAQAREVARGKMMVLDPMIYPPKPPKNPTVGGLETDLDTPAQEQAAQQAYAQAQQAYAEAQQIVADARAKERTAHEQLISALDGVTSGLRQMRAHGGWEQAAASPSSPAATDLASAAAAAESYSTGASRALFEGAMRGGPASVHGTWSMMTTAQRADLINGYPKMVGSTNGVPIAARDKANMARLAEQKQAAKKELAQFEEMLQRSAGEQAAPRGQWMNRVEQLEDAIAGIEKLETALQPDDKFLIGIESTANDGRGEVIVATGNPDKADHVMTFVPGVTSDLGGVAGAMNNNEAIIDRAKEIAPNKDFASITWMDYESPAHFTKAMPDGYANEAKDDLDQFQESLRITHEGPPSHNTVLGHSYGSTVTGYTARDEGLAADDVIFLGSPGVGVEHASGLNMDSDDVWAATSETDMIHKAVAPEQAIGVGPPTDDHWFGTSPADPAFGGHVLPVDPDTAHGGYWQDEKTVNAVAHVVAGQTEGMEKK